jgi:hypothetical protein
MRTKKAAVVMVLVVSCALFVEAQSKPKLTLDEFFNSVSFSAIELSPDGNSVVIGAERADWDQQIPIPSGRRTDAGSHFSPSARRARKRTTILMAIQKTKASTSFT